MSRICLLLATSYAMFGLKAVRKRIFTNQEKEAGEVPAGGDKHHICTLVEDPRSAVKFGIFMQFPVKNCLIHCNANSIITETVIDKKNNSYNAFIQARANEKNAGCACYSVTAPDEEEFLFGFTPRAQCDAEACWKKYLDVSRHVITSVQRKNQLKMDADDYLDSANHYSTKEEEGDELSDNCRPRTPDKSDYRMIFPTSVNMKNTLLKLGDTTGLDPTEAAKVRQGAARDLKTLESTITIEDPEELEEEEYANLVAETQSMVQPDDSMPTKTDDDTEKELVAAEEVADEVVEPDQSKGKYSDSMPGGESNVAKCGAEADAWERANCICSLANDGKAGPRVKDMEAACNELALGKALDSVNAMDLAKPWSCSIKKKKKTGKKSCGASRTYIVSGGYGGASKQRSAAASVTMNIGA